MLLVLLWTIVPICAQIRFDGWTAEDGLPQNIVRGIRQTPEGYLWIATLDGVARFDGMRFTLFNKGNTAGITSNRFGSMVAGKDGDLWFVTEDRRITRYHHGSFRAYGAAEGLTDDGVLGITSDNSGQTWILLTTGIYRWDEATSRFSRIAQSKGSFQEKALRWGTMGFWGWDARGLHCFVEGRFLDYPLPAWLPGSTIWEVAMAQDGAVWLETFQGKHVKIVAGGATMLSGEANTQYKDRRGHLWPMQVGHQLNRTIEGELRGSSSAVTITLSASSDLYEDREGSLWAGTEGQGLYRLQQGFIHVYSSEQGLVARNAYPVYEDRSGAVWVGAWGTGLSRIAEGRFTNYTVANGLPNGLITAICEDHEGRLWIASHGRLSVLENGKIKFQRDLTFPTTRLSRRF